MPFHPSQPATWSAVPPPSSPYANSHSRNSPPGPYSLVLGLAELWYLDLTNNSGMSGTLPSTLTDLRLLTEFWASGTDLCAPRDADFQRWLAEVASQRVAQCAYGGTSTAYLTQAIQSLDFPVPLVGDEEALLRVFVTAENAAGELIPPVRASFFLGGAEVRVLEIPQGTHSIPAEIIEGDLSASANANVPADLIQPGLEVGLFTRIGARVRASGGWPGSGRDWLHSSRRFGVRRLCA